MNNEKRKHECQCGSSKQCCDASENQKEMRVWWTQVGGDSNPFIKQVANEADAVTLLDTLAEYDAHRLLNNIVDGTICSGGVELLDGDSWIDWWSIEL